MDTHFFSGRNPSIKGGRGKSAGPGRPYRRKKRGRPNGRPLDLQFLLSAQFCNTSTVMDCAGKVLLTVLAAPPDPGVTTTLGCAAIALMFALLYRKACADVVVDGSPFTESVDVKSP